MSKFNEIKQLRRMVDSSILRMPGVMAVSTGYKKVKSKKTDELSVIIYVAKKLPLSRIPYFHAIPASMKIRDMEVTTDIVEVGYYTPFAYDSYQRPALGGDSIGHLSVTAGTLGGLVCGPACEEEEDSVLILSNNHVLAAINKGEKGDHIVQPGTYDGGSCHDNCIAELERYVPIDFSEDAVNYVDCAVARPYNSADISFEIRDIGIPNISETYNLSSADVLKSLQVQKTGRTTEHTVGYVSAVDWKGTVLYDWSPVYFEQQIVVESLSPGTPVALGGDSGSLVLTMDNKICGLLFAGPSSGDHYLANHISRVFSGLNVRLCCAPTEAVRGTESKRILHELRRLRDKIRVDKSMKKHLDLYGKYAGLFFQEFLRDPKLKAKGSEITIAASEMVVNKEKVFDEKLYKLCSDILDTLIRKNKDKDFANEMKKVKEIIDRARDKTLEEIFEILRKMQ